MAQSFTARPPVFCEDSQRAPSAKRRRVLVTGATGNIGSYFVEHARTKYDLVLMLRDKNDPAEVERFGQFGEVVVGDIGDPDRLKSLFTGVDTVLHLAAAASENSTWEQVLPANIVGTYNVMVAAKHAGVRRVIYASSIHAVSGYPADVQVKTSEPVNPGDLYGVSKCFGEAMGRYMAEQEGMSVIALRIGAFQPDETAKDANAGVQMMNMFVSRRDLIQLIEKCIDVEHLQFAIFHGLSDNHFKRLDISDARELVGYNPQDDATELNPALEKLHFDDRVLSANQHDPGQKSGIRRDV